MIGDHRSAGARTSAEDYRKRKVALITGEFHAMVISEQSLTAGTVAGITGQDGSYLTELLLSKGYTVHGIIRRSSSFNTGRIEHLYKDVHERASRSCTDQSLRSSSWD